MDGLTSPKLFDLYMNELIGRLSIRHMGCWVDNVCVNNLGYADDVALLDPMASSIRELLHICEQYVVEYGLHYNAKKCLYSL